MPKKKIMVLGNDFGPKNKGVRNNPYGNLHSSATWRNLLELLPSRRHQAKELANALYGLRVAGGPQVHLRVLMIKVRKTL